MPHKRYNLVDNGYLQLANVLLSISTTVNIYFPITYNWNKTLPTSNWIGTLVKYGTDGNPIKVEKVYVTATSGTTLTITRGYLGDVAQAFDVDDYLFLNVVAENLNDIHTRIDEVEAYQQGQITDIYANGSDRLKVYRLTADPALQVRIGAGTFRVGGVEGQYAGGTLTVGASLTTYIMINSSGVIQTSTVGWNSLYTRLGIVISGVSTITSITKWRNDAVGGMLGGLSFDDTQGTNTQPNDYNDSSFKAQFKTITNIGLNGIATGTYARLVGFRGQASSSFGLVWETAYCDNGIYIRSGSTTTWGPWYKQATEVYAQNNSYLQNIISFF